MIWVTNFLLPNHYFFTHPSNYGTAFLVKNKKEAMPEDRLNPQPDNNESVERNENTENVKDDRFESDTQKIIRRHLENKDDIITDEDIRNVRVGVTPAIPDAATLARFEDEEEKEDLNDSNQPGNPVTPWDLTESPDE